MTEGQKDILICKMLDAPASLTEEEVTLILHDEELKDIYEASVLVGGALASEKEFDAEQEWRLFRHKILPRPSLTKRFMRIAAIFLGVMAVGGILGRVIDYTLTKGYEEQVAERAKSTTQETHEIKEDTPIIPYVEPTAMPEPAKQPPIKAIASTASKPIKTPQTEEEEEIDVEEYLRQQQEEIEDAIIRQNAEIYVDEYYAMKEFISGMNDETQIITE